MAKQKIEVKPTDVKSVLLGLVNSHKKNEAKYERLMARSEKILSTQKTNWNALQELNLEIARMQGEAKVMLEIIAALKPIAFEDEKARLN